MSNGELDKAKEYCLKNLDYNKLIHGLDNLNVSNGYFILSQLSLKQGNLPEAVENMS